jgi:pimeloyl-ACP methyl ester carboxylesterase
MRPTVEALARECRVVTFSFGGNSGAGPQGEGHRDLDALVRQLDAVLDRAGLDAATLCGISFGGLVALRYAAVRPERVSGLILVSTPPPSWTTDRRLEAYLKSPRLLAPLFVARSPGRLWPEIAAAHPDWRVRLAFGARHLLRVAAAPFSPTLMAARVRAALGHDFEEDCRRVVAPVLVVTGEGHLDRVVPVDATREYVDRIPGARAAVLERTGHIGSITRADEFAAIVRNFMHAAVTSPSAARRRA